MQDLAAEQPPTGTTEATEALVERVFAATLSLFDLASIHLGDRLGLYRALAGEGATTSGQLAERTETDERYVREWLEQQAVTGILTVDDQAAAAAERRYALPAGHAEALVEPDSPSYIAPLGRQALGMLRPLAKLVEAFRTGSGIDYADYGEDTREGIADLNRVGFVNELGRAWLPAMPEVDRALHRDGARVADIGCGVGWSAIAIARAYPACRVDGFDLDPGSVERARANAAAAGVADRAGFEVRDAADPDLAGGYTLVTMFETLHDMAHPVEALANARRLLAADGVVLVADPRTSEQFTAPGDEVERLMYGFSIIHCLAVGRVEHDSTATGTVMRPATLRRYAQEAGFGAVEELAIENDFWRFYRLDP